MAVSNKPWGDITEADYADAADYCGACLVNTNDGPRARWAKGNCHLPIREPISMGRAVNRNALGAAAAALAGARGGVDISPDLKRQAARDLMRAYMAAGMDPPPSLQALAR